MLDALDALETGREPGAGGRRKGACVPPSLIFARNESSRRRGRVELPLEIDDSPLQAMIASGELAGQLGLSGSAARGPLTRRRMAASSRSPRRQDGQVRWLRSGRERAGCAHQSSKMVLDAEKKGWPAAYRPRHG